MEVGGRSFELSAFDNTAELELVDRNPLRRESTNNAVAGIPGSDYLRRSSDQAQQQKLVLVTS